MLAKLTQSAAPLSVAQLSRISHVLFILPVCDMPDALPAIPGVDTLRTLLKRKNKKCNDLVKTPIAGMLPDGGLAVWVMPTPEQSAFELQTLLRRACLILLEEQPAVLTIALYAGKSERERFAETALYCAWVNAVKLPTIKTGNKPRKLQALHLAGATRKDAFAMAAAHAEGNILTRALSVAAPNVLTPAAYRAEIRKLAKSEHWQIEEYDYARLKKMGAGAFCAVAQGSPDRDAAIVHLVYAPKTLKKSSKTVALVGKGICFDTGGHNLKPAAYMTGMHEDMNGSAVALGILTAATRLKLPLRLDVWLAIAQNHIGPNAYKQNDIVTALDGTTIEIVHTDAEGRMVLADALTLAIRNRKTPDLVVDFATLTGSMKTALGRRMCGVFATSPALARLAVKAGASSGERVNTFPMPADYDDALDSKVADIKQCTLDGGADHILAARLLSRFVGDHPWLHVDLSAAVCTGGLGAVGTDTTGFGIGWGLEILQTLHTALPG